jgi:hypothetical protein
MEIMEFGEEEPEFEDIVRSGLINSLVILGVVKNLI